MNKINDTLNNQFITMLNKYLLEFKIDCNKFIQLLKKYDIVIRGSFVLNLLKYKIKLYCMDSFNIKKYYINLTN